MAAIRRMIEIKVSYDRDLDMADKNCEFWAALALTPEQKEGIEDPIEMERLANANLDRAHTRFITSNDPEEVVERIAVYAELGFDELILHAPGPGPGPFPRPVRRGRAAAPARAACVTSTREEPEEWQIP